MRAGYIYGSTMSAYTQDLTVNWGESDPFGLVYYAREVAWFNEIEHELFRQIGHPINRMISEDRSAFVMGEIQFRFVGPAAYGDRVQCTLTLVEVREKTVHWLCNAVNLSTGQQVTEGKATRVFAKILDDGNLQSQAIPDEIREALSQFKDNGK
jgi:YbgC/YbaW family acyl-CoA thioester hydrolase